ncbi:MAG: hypothetical protein D6722_05430 [Bacteroidetes bacterium]|nr:MAG: hypothetical protein D6722_05430 [Bacteroidota bacterium]
MATTQKPLEAFAAAQNQMIDMVMENYDKFVDTFATDENGLRAGYALSKEYFTKMRELLNSMTTVDTPQAWTEAMMDVMQKSSDLNMEYSNKFMEMYKDFFNRFMPFNQN